MMEVKIKNQKTQKSVPKRKLKFETFGNCLNKTNYLEKNEINIGSIEKDHKDFIKTIN